MFLLINVTASAIPRVMLAAANHFHHIPERHAWDMIIADPGILPCLPLPPFAFLFMGIIAPYILFQVSQSAPWSTPAA